MAWLSDASLNLDWPEDEPAKAAIAYTINSNPQERAEYILDWNEYVLLLVRAGDFPRPQLSLSPRPPDADRILKSGPPVDTVRIDSASPPAIARTHEYTFSRRERETMAPSDWDRLYAYINLLPGGGVGDNAIAELENVPPYVTLANMVVPTAYFSEVVPPGDPDRVVPSGIALGRLTAALEGNTEAVTRVLVRLQPPGEPDRPGEQVPPEPDRPGEVLPPDPDMTLSAVRRLTAALEGHTEAVTRLLVRLQLPPDPDRPGWVVPGDPERLINALERQTEVLMRFASGSRTPSGGSKL